VTVFDLRDLGKADISAIDLDVMDDKSPHSVEQSEEKEKEERIKN
jgi:hypothetical protein